MLSSGFEHLLKVLTRPVGPAWLLPLPQLSSGGTAVFSKLPRCAALSLLPFLEYMVLYIVAGTSTKKVGNICGHRQRSRPSDSSVGAPTALGPESIRQASLCRPRHTDPTLSHVAMSALGTCTLSDEHSKY